MTKCNALPLNLFKIENWGQLSIEDYDAGESSMQIKEQDGVPLLLSSTFRIKRQVPRQLLDPFGPEARRVIG